MRKGSGGSQVITVLSNSGSNGGSYTLNLGNSGYSSGANLVEVYTCSSVTVGSDGKIPVPMASGLPRVLVPASWMSGSGLCGSSSTTTLVTATTTPTGSSSSTTLATAVTTPTGSCKTATTVPVVLEESVRTSYGENIFISGSIPQLGSWNPDKAVALSSSQYTSSNPLWAVTLDLPVGTSFEYKFLKKEQNGGVAWENDPNRSYTVPEACAGTSQKVDSSWR